MDPKQVIKRFKKQIRFLSFVEHTFSYPKPKFKVYRGKVDEKAIPIQQYAEGLFGKSRPSTDFERAIDSKVPKGTRVYEYDEKGNVKILL